MQKVTKIAEIHFWPKKNSTENAPKMTHNESLLMTQNSPKITQNGPKNTQNWPKMTQNCTKWPKTFFHLWADSNSPLFSSLTSSYCHKTLLNLFNETARSISKFGIFNWTITLKQINLLCLLYLSVEQIDIRNPNQLSWAINCVYRHRAACWRLTSQKGETFFIPNWTELVKCPFQW